MLQKKSLNNLTKELSTLTNTNSNIALTKDIQFKTKSLNKNEVLNQVFKPNNNHYRKELKYVLRKNEILSNKNDNVEKSFKSFEVKKPTKK